jgi:hypothetical protein
VSNASNQGKTQVTPDQPSPRIAVDIDEELLAEAMAVEEATGPTTVVEHALTLLIQTCARERLLASVGTYDLDLTLDELARIRAQQD